MNDSRQQVAATEPSDLRLKASATCHTIINGAFERRKRGRTRQPASITTTTTNENGTQIISIKSKSRPRRKRNNFCQINPNFPSVRGRVICCLGAGALISATVLMSLIIFSLFSTPTLANQQQQPFQTRSSRASSSSFMNGQAQPQMIPTTTTTTTSANPASTTTNQQQENQSSSNNHNRIILNQAPDPLVASISEHTSTVTWMKSNARGKFLQRFLSSSLVDDWGYTQIDAIDWLPWSTGSWAINHSFCPSLAHPEIPEASLLLLCDTWVRVTERVSDQFDGCMHLNAWERRCYVDNGHRIWNRCAR